MMKKNKSKNRNQLKYLVLIPVLVSMLFYTSCGVNKIKEKVIAKKELQTIYTQFDKELEITKGEKETYLDFYTGSIKPNWDEISYKDLSSKEQLEYDNLVIILKERDNSVSKSLGLKLYKGKNGRNIVGKVFDMSNKMIAQGKEVRNSDGSVSFMKIEKAPTFPGCEEGDKKCFSRNVQMHFGKNFNSDLPKSLGLSPGRKRVFIAFKINKEGNIADIKARAPHQDIEKEIIRVMSLLPKVKPGEQDGKTVAVKFTIPFTLFIEKVDAK